MIQHSSIHTSGIILAGGSSRRMGKNKALLSHPDNRDVTFIEHLVALLVECCAETVIVAGVKEVAADYGFPGTRVIYDETPGVGPLMGLYSGLSSINTARALVIAVDLPCVQPTLLSFLLSQSLPTDSMLVPLVDNIPQVLLAIYPRSILPLIKEQLLLGRRELRSLLEVAPVQFVDEAQLRLIEPGLRSFLNVNTPEELRKLL